jgi:broad specificity phosphatase PhoE
MPASTIYYIRHGETSWNAEGRLQGAQDVPLNDLGRKQAAHAGRILADLFLRDGRDKATLSFVSSPLGRARSTMELVRGEMKLPPSEYGIDDRLREIAYGQWEGSTLAEMQLADPELFERRQLEKWTVARRAARAMSRCRRGCRAGTTSCGRTRSPLLMAAPRGR